MFCHLDPVRLSSDKQSAEVLFYPGANASQMLNKLRNDPKFAAIKLNNVMDCVTLTLLKRIFHHFCMSSGQFLVMPG